MKSLKVVEHKRFENDTFLEAVTCSSVSEKKEFYIVLSEQHLIIFGSKLNKTKMFCKIRDICSIECKG